jgi:hypothetical protein
MVVVVAGVLGAVVVVALMVQQMKQQAALDIAHALRQVRKTGVAVRHTKTAVGKL